jgi:hypothetical protein
MNFIHRFSKNIQISNFTKIRLVGAELFHADGRTEKTKLLVVFRNSETRLERMNELYLSMADTFGQTVTQ